jgi:hypothetical protein
MAKTSDFISFTKDVRGRHLCNDFSEAEVWRCTGGRPSTPQDPRPIGLQTHAGRLLFRRIQWRRL